MTDDEIDLRDLLMVLWRNRLLIASIFLVAVVVAGAISLAMPSVYRVTYLASLGNYGDPIYTNPSSASELMLSDQFLADIIDSLKQSPQHRRSCVN